MNLFSKQYSDNGDPLIILHGLFGNQGNWGQHIKFFSDSFSVHGFDLRNHGRSAWQESMSSETLANDVRETMISLGIKSAHVIGHSMGGKTAMQLALSCPAMIKKLVVVDIAPVQYEAHHNAVFAGLDDLDPALIKTRREADEILAKHISEKAVRDFLLANLIKDEEGEFQWRMNLQAIRQEYPKLNAGLQADKPFEKEVLFVKGGESDYILKEYEKAIFDLFPAAKIEEVKNAGHWLHAQFPKEFQSLVLNFLK